MHLILIILIVLLLCGGVGAHYGNWGGNPAYGYSGIGLGGLLLVVLIALFLTGGL